MPRLRLDLDKETLDALAAQALAERRPVHLQAEVMLRLALRLPFPYPADSVAVPTMEHSHATTNHAPEESGG